MFVGSILRDGTTLLWSLHGKNNQKVSAISNATIKVDYHVVIVTNDDLTQTSTTPSVINGV